jgi:ketosteroid isomerase-like protein
LSSQNVEVATRAIAAFNSRDVDGFAVLTTPDFEWSPSMSPIEGEVFVGREGIRKYFSGLESAWEHFHVLPGRALDRGQLVLVLGRLEGRGRGSGATVEAALGMAFELREGMISRIHGYLDQDEAMKVTGLHE